MLAGNSRGCEAFKAIGGVDVPEGAVTYLDDTRSGGAFKDWFGLTRPQFVLLAPNGTILDLAPSTSCGQCGQWSDARYARLLGEVAAEVRAARGEAVAAPPPPPPPLAGAPNDDEDTIIASKEAAEKEKSRKKKSRKTKKSRKLKKSKKLSKKAAKALCKGLKKKACSKGDAKRHCKYKKKRGCAPR